ncbi:baseplate protein J [Calothrix sp. FACHB-156]|nr:baseplate protein J [Calothrix sp. FACHB-156]
MTLPLPNLDDRTYTELVEQARARIPIECPEWTDHNPSDTGIILIEMLAWLSEMVLYRVNQVPDRSLETFLGLLKTQITTQDGSKPWTLAEDTELIQQFQRYPGEPLAPEAQLAALKLAIQQTVLQLRKRYRAVNCEDFEQLTLIDWNQDAVTKNLGLAKIMRAQCLVQKNLDASDPNVRNAFAPGHISLVIVPSIPFASVDPNLCKQLKDFLDTRKLLTTRLHVVGVAYVELSIQADLYLLDGANVNAVEQEAKNRIKTFFHPLESGSDWQGKGWPFGRAVPISEVYALLDKISGIDYVRNVKLTATGQPEVTSQSTPSTISLNAHELVAVKTITLKFKDRFGNEWQ